MAARLPTPKNPVILGALVVGGLWFMGRARAQRTAITGPRSSGTQDYSTPTGVAANFARAIVQLTKNLQTAPAAHADATSASQLDIAGMGAGANSGAWGFGTVGGVFGQQLGDPVFGWSAPNRSAVANVSVSQYGSEVDQIPAAPLYNPATDFTNNPVGFGSGAYNFGG